MGISPTQNALTAQERTAKRPNQNLTMNLVQNAETGIAMANATVMILWGPQDEHHLHW